MTFKQWLFGSIDNPSINGQWKPLHISVLINCITAIIILACIFRKKSLKIRKRVIYVLASLLIFFEVARRIKNLIAMTDWNFSDFLYIMLPRPFCAISSFSLIFSTFFKSTNYKNFASIISLLCAVIFFAYPEAGFNNQFILFENLYSIATHSLLLVMSITLITLKFTNFDYNTIWKELIFFAVAYLYAFQEIYILDIASDPLYFMPDGDIQNILGMNFPLYLITYISFVTIFVGTFYVINHLCSRKKQIENVVTTTA